MKTFIALLRGINVGGKNIIKMADLRLAFESIGLYEVKTYIQSGNVLFKSDETEEILQSKIERKIEDVFGFSVTVVLKTSEEIEEIISNCPFSKKEISEAESSSGLESLYVAILADIPFKEKVMLLNTYVNGNNKYEILGRNVYLLLSQSIRNSKLANNLHKLSATVTVRNWKTIEKLADLAKAIDN